jgi:hypothetical protein
MNFFVLTWSGGKIIENHLTSLLSPYLKGMILFYRARIGLIVARTRQFPRSAHYITYLLRVAYLETALRFYYLAVVGLVSAGTWCLIHFLLFCSGEYDGCWSMVLLN